MTRSYDPNEIVVLARLITQAVADLGSRDEFDKELIAGRVLSLVEKGECSFQKLLAAGIRDQHLGARCPPSLAGFGITVLAQRA